MRFIINDIRGDQARENTTGVGLPKIMKNDLHLDQSINSCILNMKVVNLIYIYKNTSFVLSYFRM